ncbi:hypothetical protein V6N13_008996 [Hibiscus sabdariffa]
MGWKLRMKGTPCPLYGPHATWFTIVTHNGGVFSNARKLKYNGKKVAYFDFCVVDEMSLFEVIHMIESLGIENVVKVFRAVPNRPFKVLPLTDDNDVLNMVAEFPRNCNVHLYLVEQDHTFMSELNDEHEPQTNDVPEPAVSDFEFGTEPNIKTNIESGTEPNIETNIESGTDPTDEPGYHGGHLLIAIVIDANVCIYPIAFVAVESECHSSWCWFVQLLGEDLDLNNSYHICFMLNRQKGLKEALAEYFPYYELRFCVRHLYNNFKGKALKDSFWKAATSIYKREFQVALAKIESLSPQAFEWLKNVDPKFWSKSPFSTRSKCDMLLNNLYESFNKCVLEARSKPIIIMLEGIQTKIMNKIAKKKAEADKWTGVLCPKIQKKLEAATEMSNRKWDLTGIPCPHAISVILMREQRLESYVDDCYKTKTQQAIYSHMIHPVRGRPHKNRRKEANETTNPNAKVFRKRLIMKCKKCGGCGHNVRTCKGKVGENRFVHSQTQTQASTETRQPKLPVKRRFCGTTKECATTTTAPTQEAPQVQQPSAIQVVRWMIGSQESSISHCTPNVATSTRNDQ